MEQEKKVTVSEQIRQLYDIGMKTKDIAKELGIRYQFAYNVISVYVQEQEFAKNQLAATTAEQPPQEKPQPVQPPVPPQQPTQGWSTVKPPPPLADEPKTVNLQPFSMKSVEEMEGKQTPAAQAQDKKNVLARLFQK